MPDAQVQRWRQNQNTQGHFLFTLTDNLKDFLSALRAILIVLIVIMASIDHAAAGQTERFELVGSTLFIDLDVEYYEDDWSSAEVRRDHRIITNITFANPEIALVVLTGQGGSFFDALIAARRFKNLGLATEARGDCLSSCALMFMGGRERKLYKDATLGFHRMSTHMLDMQSAYEEKRQQFGWADEFAFAEWNYRHGQIDAKDVLELAVDQGISPMAIVRLLSADAEDMWFPDRNELIIYNIVTE